MNTQTAIRDRELTDGDAQSVVDLFNACEAVDQFDESFTIESMQLSLNDANLDKARDIRLWETEAGELIGVGWLRLRKSEEEQRLDSNLNFRVHPDFRNLHLEDTVLGWAFDRTRQAGSERALPVRLTSGTRDNDTARLDLLAQHGMTPERYFFTMVRDLTQPIPEMPLPEGFTLGHSSKSSADAEKWVEAFNLSFIDHWGHHPATVEHHTNWLSHSDYKPEYDLIALAPDGIVAAFCFCWIDTADNAKNQRLDGWIDVLGTRRGYRKIGLGRAMLLAGLQKLKDAGMTVGKLGVDAENPTGALKLYESVGFTRLDTHVVYSLDL